MLIPDEEIKDIGRVKYGEVHTFNYTITNTGTTEAIIKKVVVGCSSCTVASVSPNKIKPGENGIVKVQFTPGTISKQLKHIDILYNDTGLRLQFKGESYG